MKNTQRPTVGGSNSSEKVSQCNVTEKHISFLMRTIITPEINSHPNKQHLVLEPPHIPPLTSAPIFKKWQN